MALCPDDSIGNRLEPNNNGHFITTDFSANTLPTFLAMYLWDASSHGRLFKDETYHKNVLDSFIKTVMTEVVESTPFPQTFTRESILRLFLNQMDNAFKKSNFENAFSSVDTKDVESIKTLVKKNNKRGIKGFESSIKFLKQEPFPAVLWLEFSRFEQIFYDSMKFMLDRLEFWFKLAPKYQWSRASRSKLAKSLSQPHRDLANSYFEVMNNFLKIYLFMEIWSCEKESELFTDKKWSFKKINYPVFERVVISFHESLNQLQLNLISHDKATIPTDFSSPTKWAFKQLLQMT